MTPQPLAPQRFTPAPYRCNSNKTHFGNTASQSAYWTAACLCGKPHDDEPQWVCRTCITSPCVCGTRRSPSLQTKREGEEDNDDDADDDEPQWVCRACNTSPCVCGTRRAASPSPSSFVGDNSEQEDSLRRAGRLLCSHCRSNPCVCGRM